MIIIMHAIKKLSGVNNENSDITFRLSGDRHEQKPQILTGLTL